MHSHEGLLVLFFYLLFLSVRIKTHTVCYDSHACALCGLRFRSLARNDSLFALLFYFCFIYVLFVLKQTQFDMSLLFSELIHIQQEVKLFGPAF